MNLTAGLEFLLNPIYCSLYENNLLSFLRCQSTYLEQKLFQKFLQEIDNNFLMHLAIGTQCIVLDCTSRKKKNNTSRACWQGLAWLEYCLNRIWFKKETKVKYGMEIYFNEQYKLLDKCTKNKLRYFRKFLKTDKLDLHHLCEPTDNDGKEEFYQMLVNKYL